MGNKRISLLEGLSLLRWRFSKLGTSESNFSLSLRLRYESCLVFNLERTLESKEATFCSSGMRFSKIEFGTVPNLF